MTFANAALVPWLGLISIPIIIHILNRRRFRVVRWAAMEFLLQADRKNRRRVRIEHLLILLLRCLAVALAVLFIARPATTSGMLAALPGARGVIERVIVLDDSASMSERRGEKRAYDVALESLRKLLEQLHLERPADLVTLVRGSRRAPELSRTSAGSAATDEVLKRSAAWKEPTDGRFRVADVLKVALGGKPATEGETRIVYVLTDLRRVDWADGEGRLQKEIAAELRAAGKETACFVVDCAAGEGENLGVIALTPTERLVAAGIGQKLAVTVRNFGKRPTSQVPMRLSVTGGDALPLPPLPEVAPGAERKVEFAYTFADAGASAVKVELEHDRFERDDARAVALEVVKAVRVLVIDGHPSDEAFEGAADFVSGGLAPPGEVRSGVEPTTIPFERVPDEDLTGHHAVVACELERWPEARLPALERFVQRGGGLALFVGDGIDVASWQRDLWKDGKGLLPCKLGELLATGRNEASIGLEVVSLDHPLLRVFQGDDNPLLRHVRVRKRYACPVDPKKDATTTVMLRYGDPEKTPAILEKPYGDGRVVLMNVTANRAWSEWPRDPSFPVTCQELVRYLAPSATAGRVVAVGEPIVRGLNPAKFEPRARLEVPGETRPRELSAAPREGSDDLWLVFDDTLRAGVYRLELFQRGGGSRLEPYAVVLDPRESELDKGQTDVLPKGLEGVNIRFAPASEKPLLSLTEGDRTELWRSCAIALVVVLALEALLAFRAARHGDALAPDELPTMIVGRAS